MSPKNFQKTLEGMLIASAAELEYLLPDYYDDEKIPGIWAGDALSALKNIGEPAVDAVTTVLYGCGGETFTNRDSWEVLNETIGWLREVIDDKKTSAI